MPKEDVKRRINWKDQEARLMQFLAQGKAGEEAAMEYFSKPPTSFTKEQISNKIYNLKKAGKAPKSKGAFTGALGKAGMADCK
jgi:hypothetical protein